MRTETVQSSILRMRRHQNITTLPCHASIPLYTLSNPIPSLPLCLKADPFTSDLLFLLGNNNTLLTIKEGGLRDSLKVLITGKEEILYYTTVWGVLDIDPSDYERKKGSN